MVTSVFAVHYKSAFVFATILMLLTLNSKVEAAPSAALEEKGQKATVFDLPSAWVDQDNKAFDWKRVSGQTTLVALVYTSCQMSCPLIANELRTIESKLLDTEREKVQVLLFSFDPTRDTVSRLKEYGTKRKFDARRWTLLTGTDEGARELSVVLGTQFKKLQNGDFSHSNTLTVLDPTGQIAYQQQELGKGTEETLAAIRKAISANKPHLN